MIKVVTYTPIEDFDERMTFVLKYEHFFHDFNKPNNMVLGFDLFFSEKLWENDFVLGVNCGAFAFFAFEIGPI